jgi:membrane protein implicated in regulation of membrane protease activity
LTLLTLTVDHLSISGRGGFGWRQITGTEVGILIIVIGLLAGRGLLATSGLFLLILSLGADVLNLGHAPGLGWRKQTALALASLLLAGGILWQRTLRKRDASTSVDENEESPPQKPIQSGWDNRS